MKQVSKLCSESKKTLKTYNGLLENAGHYSSERIPHAKCRKHRKSKELRILDNRIKSDLKRYIESETEPCYDTSHHAYGNTIGIGI